MACLTTTAPAHWFLIVEIAFALPPVSVKTMRWLLYFAVLTTFVAAVAGAEPGAAARVSPAARGLATENARDGDSLIAEKNFEGAVRAYRKSIEYDPTVPGTHIKLGRTLQGLGRLDEALASYREAVKLAPKSAEAAWLLGGALALQGKAEEALKHLTEARRLDPSLVNVAKGIILTSMQLGKTNEAFTEAERAVKQWPKDGEVHSILGQLLVARGETKHGLDHYRETLRLVPDALDVLNNMAWMLATHPDASIRDGDEAVRLAERACELTSRKVPRLLGTLAAAYAEAGKLDQAVRTGEEAAQLASAKGDKQLADTNRKLVEQYRAGKAYREQR